MGFIFIVRVTAGSDGLLSRAPHMSSFQKVHRILMFRFSRRLNSVNSKIQTVAPLPFKRTQMKQIHYQTE